MGSVAAEGVKYHLNWISTLNSWLQSHWQNIFQKWNIFRHFLKSVIPNFLFQSPDNHYEEEQLDAVDEQPGEEEGDEEENMHHVSFQSWG